MGTVIKIVENENELLESFKIRRIVFVQEQNVPESIEWDEFDEGATHIIYKLDDEVVGADRIVYFDDSVKIGRVAVLKEYRLRGIGREIVEFLIKESKKRSNNIIYANVQLIAQKFYKRLGFSEEGETFYEADIEHIKMVFDD